VKRAAALLLLTACTVPSTVHSERQDGFSLRGSEPLRIAILPLRDRVPPPSVMFYLGRPFVWAARLATFDFSRSMPTTARAAEMMRTLLTARLAAESTDIVDVGPAESAKVARVANGTPAEFVALARDLDVDAVLEGELRALGAGWAVVRTNREIAGVVRLRDGRDGSVLFEADVAIGNGAGIDHGPTGWVSFIATPLAAVDSGPYTEMAIEWAEVVGRELFGTSVLAGASGEPSLGDVLVVAPDGPLGRGATVEVTTDGPVGASVHFHLGALHREIPMFPIETPAAGRGRYRGVYRVQDGDRAREAPVVVHLLMPGGGEAVRSAERRLDLAASRSDR